MIDNNGDHLDEEEKRARRKSVEDQVFAGLREMIAEAEIARGKANDRLSEFDKWLNTPEGDKETQSFRDEASAVSSLIMSKSRNSRLLMAHPDIIMDTIILMVFSYWAGKMASVKEGEGKIKDE